MSKRDRAFSRFGTAPWRPPSEDDGRGSFWPARPSWRPSSGIINWPISRNAGSRRPFGAVRIRVEPAIVVALPYLAGPRWRRHGAGLAVDPRGFLSAGEAGPGLRAFRRCRGRRPRGRTDARGMAVGQCLLALVFSHQWWGAGDRADLAHPARAGTRRTTGAGGGRVSIS